MAPLKTVLADLGQLLWSGVASNGRSATNIVPGRSEDLKASSCQQIYLLRV